MTIWKKVLACLMLTFIYGQLIFAKTNIGLTLPVQQKSAVGYYLNTNNNLSPLSYTSVNGGLTWSLSSELPLPGNVAANGSQISKLYGASCDITALVCNIIGFYRNTNNNFVPLSYTSSNGGASWSLSNPLSLPNDVAANGIQTNKLQGVACGSSSHYCSAVGFYLNNNNNIKVLSYTSVNGGTTWSLSTMLPLPANEAANGIQNNQLQSVACDTSNQICSAVGFYLNNSNNIVPLSYTSSNGGTSWSLSNQLPLPDNVAANGIQTSKLQSIFCDSTGNYCKAVGVYLNYNNNLLPLSYSTINRGVTWSLASPLPLPANVAANGSQNNELQSVACSSTGNLCSTVGFYRNTSNNIVPLSYTSVNGGVSWSISNQLPLPADVAANGIQNNKLQSVACDKTGSYCNAVGLYLNNSNNLAPLSYFSVNGGVTWSLSTTLPLPSNVAAMGIQTSVLLSVNR